MTASPLPGRPLWIDLTTHDTDGAREFYRELFGWEFEDQGADFGHYAIITKDGGRVGGLMTSMMGQEGPTSEPTGPTTWSVFLHTDDIDAALAAIPTVGGQVFYGPMDIGDQGRQAFVSDPAGAALGLWQPLDLPGFAMPGTHGTPVWFEVQSNDLDAALPFYRDVLHWDIHWLGGSPHASDGMRYAMNGPQEKAVAGICEASAALDPGAQSVWRAYLEVADADAAAAKITELGGTVQSPPRDSPFGRFAQVLDPQGAMFVIHQASPAAPELSCTS